ncbi:hypothetical protein DL96DRAFT_148426 [Flagelloscypha sp. PMI_526]|nr:hypothetical protein DL96DRAFT_148426 [Flagelloscypha sp. PMI_526]
MQLLLILLVALQTWNRCVADVNRQAIVRQRAKSMHRFLEAQKCSDIPSISRHRAHWKDHKGPCKQSRLQLSKAVAKSEPTGNSSLSQPGFVPAKIAEDIREWTNRNTDWLGGCYFQAAKLSTNSHFWRTHGVVVVLTPHNTRQSTYKFTFADAYSLAFPEMLVLAAEKGQGELFKTLLKQVPTGKSLEGDALFTSIVFIRCLDVLNIVPQVTRLSR